ncbi:hypothetical protein COX05_00940 [candidate division WWE3 bacterium CG22_combo_CG10-13_8_21_14_all_39_12]|uniref:Uncharacterized protein n=2 Tax=Katanobacteria TaxID=422282 RepID=A0A2M7X1A5_UNCKA|nr:MAG: hypothetical protein COX05_00940 [candidate division WWE3 bacterium CG22_combo_CG10-13_8_21_14_all_39_12]PJA39966.1 MAG: hypothetical protein CO179_03835 [candidate division WWE3 bacterium CG_4_9_14_3_um_filter_39_7]
MLARCTVIGDRSPTYQTSQKNFTLAFILVLRYSPTPSQEQIEKLTTIAKTVPQHWYRATYQRSTINTVGINPLYP